MQEQSPQYPSQDAPDPSWRGVLRWYLSPKKTTLITGPMFFISLALGCVLLIDGIQKGLAVLGSYPFLVFCFPGFVLFAVHVLVIYKMTRKLPGIWHRQPSTTARVVKTGGLWVGVLAFAIAFSQLEGIFANWLIGRTPFRYEELRSEAGLFSIVSPVSLKEETRTMDTGAGPLEMHSFLGSFHQVEYGVMYMQPPSSNFEEKNAERVLDTPAANLPAALNGVLVSQKTITVDGYPGRELLIEYKGKTRGAFVARTLTARTRYIAASPHMYMIQVSGPEEYLATEEVNKFFSSFKLLRR